METEEKVQENGKKCNRKKILLFGILAVVLIGLIIWAIEVIPIANYYKEEWMDAKEFVSNWNEPSAELDLLTGGLKISDSAGEHVYPLENGATLKYSVDTYWWVKYMTTSVVLEFPAEKQENVYDVSELFLEVFENIEDKKTVFERALDEVEGDKPTVIERFAVGLDWEEREPYATFTKAPILKSDSVIGYSWNLTIEEWCENFNKNLESALEDAAQAAYSWVTEIESVEPSFKEEWLATNREIYRPLNVSDFRKEVVLTDGVHENVLYGCYLPDVDGWLNKISIVVDDNGFITECDCAIVAKLFDLVEQTDTFYMEFKGYPILTGTGLGLTYSEAKAGMEEWISGATTVGIADSVIMETPSNPRGLNFMFLPNKDGTSENFRTMAERWAVKELDSSVADDTKQTHDWSLTQEELDERFRSSIYEQEAYYGTITSTYGEFLSDYMEWYDVNFFKPEDDFLDRYNFSYYEVEGYAEEYGVSTEYMYVALVFGDVYGSALYPEESGTTYYRDAMKVLMLFDEKGEVTRTIVMSQADILRSNIEDMAYYLYRSEAE